MFFAKPPFKLNRYMRYEKHGVSGFPIKCNFSLDGEALVSGSSDGQIDFYNYRSSNLPSIAYQSILWVHLSSSRAESSPLVLFSGHQSPPVMASMATSLFSRSLLSFSPTTHRPTTLPKPASRFPLSPSTPAFPGFSGSAHTWTTSTRLVAARGAVDGDYSSRRSSSSEPRETILLPGCDYNHWLIVMEFPKDPAPTREQMIDAYLNTLATVLGSMEEAKKNMYAFSTTTYTGFQCTVDEETSEKFKGLPGVLWVLPDSYIDVKNKDYGGDKYINGEIIPCKYPTYQPKQRNSSKYESRRYERRRDGPPPERRRLRKEASRSDSP